MTPLIVMLSVFLSYVLFITIRYGIQKSISYSFYVLPEGWNWIFTVFCVGFSIPALMAASVNPEHIWIIALATAGMVFVGAASHYEKTAGKYNPKQGRVVHLAGSYTGVLLSQLYIGLMGFWHFNIVFALIGLVLILLKHKQAIWWIEILAFIMMAVYLGML